MKNMLIFMCKKCTATAISERFKNCLITSYSIVLLMVILLAAYAMSKVKMFK